VEAMGEVCLTGFLRVHSKKGSRGSSEAIDEDFRRTGGRQTALSGGSFASLVLVVSYLGDLTRAKKKWGRDRGGEVGLVPGREAVCRSILQQSLGLVKDVVHELLITTKQG